MTKFNLDKLKKVELRDVPHEVLGFTKRLSEKPNLLEMLAACLNTMPA